MKDKLQKIKAVFFDQGGVVTGDRIPSPDDGERCIRKIMDMTGLDGDFRLLKKKLLAGEEEYKKWGMESLVECPASVVWPRWLLPEVPAERLVPVAEELTLLYFQSKGERSVDREIKQVLTELKIRGYRVGLISNTWSRPLVHEELKAGCLEGVFETVVLSSETGTRKPDPGIFTDALKGFGIAPENAAYVGDQPNRDVAGPKKAGYGLSIILKTKKLKPAQMENPEHIPDILIESLTELLEIFSDRNLTMKDRAG